MPEYGVFVSWNANGNANKFAYNLYDHLERNGIWVRRKSTCKYFQWRNAEYLFRAAKKDQEWNEERVKTGIHSSKHMIVCVDEVYLESENYKKELGFGYYFHHIRLSIVWRLAKNISMTVVLLEKTANITEHIHLSQHFYIYDDGTGYVFDHILVDVIIKLK